jgi:competence protein ComEC
VSRLWIGVALTFWLVIFFVPRRPPPPLREGPGEISGTLVTEIRDGQYGSWALLDTEDGPVLLDLDERLTAGRGDLILVSGEALARPGVILGRPHRGVVRVRRVMMIAETTSPVHLAGRAVRTRVIERLSPPTDQRALLAGFLVGDTSNVSEVDVVAMRRAGLSHFTAVSGSNVTLFLGLLFVLVGPLALGPKRRAVVGLVGLPVYTAATSFEPSVLRASVMAGAILLGRLVGVVLEAWQLLSGAVILLLILDPALATSAGFQLSVAATAGVLVGARWPIRGRWPLRAIAVTIGAQAAVAPLLFIHFGTVPLLSPVLNVLAAPLVASATILGAVGVIGLDPALDVAGWLAGLVLALARGAAGWPQIGPAAGLGLLVGAVVAMRWRALRSPLTLVLAAVVITGVIGPAETLPEPGMVVFDVGQGDSILLVGGDGRFMLVDGGPDPIVLLDALDRYGVHSLDIVVLTHVHADHATGLAGLVGRIPIGEVWARTRPHASSASASLIGAVDHAGIPLIEPGNGHSIQLGDLDITVLGPLRRYASPNDQSLVLLARGPARTALLSGDIEEVAQAELTSLRADVLKVPHQGGATSDPEWLVAVGAELAVISVGPNDFGHPAPWVIETLEAAGARVVRTDEQGDVVVPLG